MEEMEDMNNMINQNNMNKDKKKHVLRAPPRSEELTSTLDTIKVNQRLGEQKHYFYVRIILIITGLITIGLGIYILIRYEYFLNEGYNFSSRGLLVFFVYLYSPSHIGIFIVSFILSLFVYTFYCCCGPEKIHGAPLYDEKDISLMSMENPKKNDVENNQETDNEKQETENENEKLDTEKNENDKKKDEPKIKEEYIGINADKVTLFPYTLTIFVIMTIAFYFIALPLSIILLVKLWNDPVYEDKLEFWALYVFIFANLINGVLIVVVFFHMFIVKRKENSILKKNMEINESMINNYRREVREALKNAN